jgi:hypothetical protein
MGQEDDNWSMTNSIREINNLNARELNLTEKDLI